MEQYIQKDSLVAEIDRRIKEIEEIGTYLSPKGALTNLLCFINTLEVKEVDDEPDCKILPRPIECYSNCKECPWLATNNKARKGE